MAGDGRGGGVGGAEAFLIAALIVQARRRRWAHAALQQQQQELAHLGRVSLLGELSGAIAHEISNPLTAILSNAQAATRFLHQTPADTGEVDEILRTLRPTVNARVM
jgi:C4-dicarboxylate-specific signal transduction histidine kinase